MNNNISATHSVNFAKEFMDFIKKFGILGLAFGVVIGGAVKGLVDDLSKFILAPFINLILSKIGGLKPGQLPNFGVNGLDLGAFLSSVISFIVLMFIVFFAARVVLSRFISKEELDAMK
jgi:large conductance mechanosensitive channel